MNTAVPYPPMDLTMIDNYSGNELDSPVAEYIAPPGCTRVDVYLNGQHHSSVPVPPGRPEINIDFGRELDDSDQVEFRYAYGTATLAQRVPPPKSEFTKPKVDRVKQKKKVQQAKRARRANRK